MTTTPYNARGEKLGAMRRTGTPTSYRCRCCRVLLTFRYEAPEALCSSCTSGRCPRGRVHRHRVVDVDGRVRRTP